MSVAVRAGAAADLPSVLASEVDGFLDDAWSESLVSDGLAGGVPTIRYWVAEEKLRRATAATKPPVTRPSAEPKAPAPKG